MASDITLAVGDGARRMTYAELADIRQISMGVRNASRPPQTLAAPGWQSRGCPHPCPLSAIGDNEQRRALSRGEAIADKQRTIAALESAIATLREQLVRSEARADSLQDELTRERCRATAVQRKLIEVLTGPRRPWWRRWFR